MEKDLACVSNKVLNTTAFRDSKMGFEFPKDEIKITPDDLGYCQRAPLFNDLREFDRKSNSLRKHVIIRKLKFKLNDILLYTDNDFTETVTVMADTVYMNETLNITFSLNVRARVVSIDYPIKPILEKEQEDLPLYDGVETRYINFSEGNLIMRRRTFGGMIDIVDQHRYVKTKSKCKACEIISEQEDVEDWFDSTIMNMLNICSHVLLAEDKDSPVARKMVDFVLAFHHRKTDFKDQTKYTSAMRFLAFHKENCTSNIHFVPNYNTNDMKDFANALYTHFSMIWNVVKGHERELFHMNLHLRTLSQNIEIANDTMYQLFESEKILFFNALESADISKLIASKESQER